MSEILPPPESERNGKLRFRPAPIVLLLIILVVAWAGIAIGTEPVLLWPLPVVVPIVGGALAAAGHEPAAKMRRFWKGFAITFGIQLAVGVIVVGICAIIIQNAIGG